MNAYTCPGTHIQYTVSVTPPHIQESVAAQTIAQRGIRVVATTHGSFAGFVKNPILAYVREESRVRGRRVLAKRRRGEGR